MAARLAAGDLRAAKCDSASRGDGNGRCLQLGGGLGRLLITGNATRNYSEMFAGAFLVAVLAIVLDLLLGGLGWLASRHASPASRARSARGRRSAAHGTPLNLVGSSDLSSETEKFTNEDQAITRRCQPGHCCPAPRRLRRHQQSVGRGELAPAVTIGFGERAQVRPVVVGSADFTESKILAEIYSQALKAKGVESSTKLGIGSREIYIKALQDQSISAVPEYTGNLLLNFDANATATTADGGREGSASRAAERPQASEELSPAVDQDVYVVTKDFSAQHGITSLEDLKKIASTSTLGGPPELEKRAYGPPGLEKIYGAKFKAFVPYPKYPPKISDLDNNKIQVATFFTTDAVIAEKGYVQLEDPQSMILPQNVVPLVRSDVAEQRRLPWQRWRPCRQH